ncbi:endonuclease/exonuclease/phosphatase family protein [Thermosynechococcaceae cyanobacterium BACA0444]|uniref:Endonuclease/exonuclease/phosphatase family protein n=1 Tax=Pseudocalidococcus azoricus BACA0444 TaxID=2918990 RepID=A0AAE4FU17_9CYAN|nr:endonuclease/exonuclease/phosphatase family protein [Pseudocalidococcus azoricus]MDS3861577.1 endonuclease/exonuclease/phosphatase family protein [Pseudocalidococcus azoricus BACA0444]
MGKLQRRGEIFHHFLARVWQTYQPTLSKKWLYGSLGILVAGLVMGCGHWLGANSLSSPVIALSGEITPIHQIQGEEHFSSQVGQIVTTTGIVTGLDQRGFYLQSEQSDSTPRTSEGLFVFTNVAPTVRPGNRVAVRGRVREFQPEQAPGDLPLTQISSQGEIQVLRENQPLPAPIVLSRPPTEIIYRPATNLKNTPASLEPQARGLDFYESLEGMRVTIPEPQVVGPQNSRHQFFVVSQRGQQATGMNSRGGITIRALSQSPYLDGDFNPERLRINPKLLPEAQQHQALQVGDRLANLTGILTYNWGNYEVLLDPEQSLKPTSSKKLMPETTSLKGDQTHLTVATFNVENLSVQEPERIIRVAQAIHQNLQNPDLIALQEIQDDSGSLDNGIVSAAQTAQLLINGIKHEGGPDYEYLDISPINNADGGQPGGNIRVAFLYNPQRLNLVNNPQGPGQSQTPVQIKATGLSHNPGRIQPQDLAWRAGRKPLIAQFRWQDQTIYAINVHLKSKRGDAPLMGLNQPPTLGSQGTRMAQTQILQQFIGELQQQQPQARIILLGDMNDFAFSLPLQQLSQAPANLANLTQIRLPEVEQYSYIYEGNSQQLDHIWVSQNVVQTNPTSAAVDIVHLNAEFSPQISDHDPVVCRLVINADGGT